MRYNFVQFSLSQAAAKPPARGGHCLLTLDTRRTAHNESSLCSQPAPRGELKTSAGLQFLELAISLADSHNKRALCVITLT